MAASTPRESEEIAKRTVASPSRLLNIAQELKDAIYRYALYDRRWLTQGTNYPSGMILQKRTLALLLVNKEVSKDCIAIFYAIRVFNSACFDDFSARLTDPHQLKFIQHVRITWRAWETLEKELGENRGDLKKVTSKMNEVVGDAFDKGLRQRLLRVSCMIGRKMEWLRVSELHDKIKRWRVCSGANACDDNAMCWIWKK